MLPESNDPVMAIPAVQCPPVTIEVSTSPLADIELPIGHPIIQPRSLTTETQEISSLPHQRVTPPTSPAVISNEELEAYFNAPIT